MGPSSRDRKRARLLARSGLVGKGTLEHVEDRPRLVHSAPVASGHLTQQFGRLQTSYHAASGWVAHPKQLSCGRRCHVRLPQELVELAASGRFRRTRHANGTRAHGRPADPADPSPDGTRGASLQSMRTTALQATRKMNLEVTTQDKLSVILRLYSEYVRLDLDRSLCVGCDVCTAVCPRKAVRVRLEAGGLVADIDEDNCILCEVCAAFCPTGALSM